MSKAQQAINPRTITDLASWARNYAKKPNLEFDPVTGVPTVYEPSKEGNNVVAKTFPWINEYDIPTVLSNPSKFDPSVLSTATMKASEMLDIRRGIENDEDTELEQAMSKLMNAWRLYHASTASDRGLRIQDVLTAEQEMRDLEATKGRNQRRRVIAEENPDSYAIHFEEFIMEERVLSK
jgi:hypothetical protein